MLNVGLVGFGFAGKTFHAPVIRVVEGLRLTTIVQRHGGGAPDPRYPDTDFVRSVDDLLSRAVDLVVIATPNTTHHPIAKQCLEAGRHVVVDKPFTTTVAEAEELVRLGDAKRRVLSAYQNRRYVGDFVTLRALLSENALGSVTTFESHFDRFRPELRPGAWREQPLPGSGLWFDLGSHLLDQALVLFGIPQAISADIRCPRHQRLVHQVWTRSTGSGPEVRPHARRSRLGCGGSRDVRPADHVRGNTHDCDRALELHALLSERPRRDPREGAAGDHARTGTRSHARTGAGRRQQSPALRCAVARVNVAANRLLGTSYSRSVFWRTTEGL